MQEGEWRESAPLGPAAAPLRPGVVYEGSAPLGRPWAHDGLRSARGCPPRALKGRDASSRSTYAYRGGLAGPTRSVAQLYASE